MSLTDSTQVRGIVARAKALILSPRSEWDVIATEAATVKSLFTGYVMYVAAIPPVCQLIGSVLFMHRSIIGALVGGVLSYALSLAMVYIMGMIIDALAPTFGGTKDRIAAMKVAAYFPTASWLCGIFSLIPVLGLLSLLGLYSLFVLYLGLPKLMKAPEDKAMAYTAVVILVAIIAGIIVGMVASVVSLNVL